MIEPKPRPWKYFFARSFHGLDGSPAHYTLSTFGFFVRYSATFAAFDQ